MESRDHYDRKHSLFFYHKGTRPLSQCYYDKMKIKFVKKYCRNTLESLLNQFNSGNSHLGHRTFPDN